MHNALVHSHLSRITLVVVVLVSFLPLAAVAQTMQSGTYQVRSGSFGSGGAQEASSETHQQSGTFGEAIAGDEATSESYQSGGGEAYTRGTSTQSSATSSAESSQDQTTSGGGGGGSGTRSSGQTGTSSVDTQTDSDVATLPDTPADNRGTGVDNIATAIGARGDGLFGDGAGEHATGTADTERTQHEPTTSAFTWHDWLWLALSVLILFLLLFWKRQKDKEEAHRNYMNI